MPEQNKIKGMMAQLTTVENKMRHYMKQRFAPHINPQKFFIQGMAQIAERQDILAGMVKALWVANAMDKVMEKAVEEAGKVPK